MQSAQVLLGLLPGMLALAGFTTIEIGVLALRRPLLAFLLAAGSPAANPLRTAAYKGSSDIFEWSACGNFVSGLDRGWRRLIAAAQYLLALAAIANLALLCWELGVRTVLAWSPNSVVYPGVWALLAVGMHISGVIAVSLRVRLIEIDSKVTSSQAIWPGLKRIISRESELCSSQPLTKLVIRPEGPWVPLMTWFTATCTLAHLIFGVFTFSGILFIGFGDALVVVIRLMASIVLCRIILVFELSGMKRVVDMS